MLLEELTWRGMFQDAMPGTAEHLAAGRPVSGYIGFDPTAPSLHIGNLASIMLLVHLQRAGHRPVALVGGATGMIGDPSGKSAERNLLDEDTLRANQAGIGRQLQKFLDFNDSPTGALLVNNYDWFKSFGFLEFLRDVGKHLTVNYMMKKDSVKKRLGDVFGEEFTRIVFDRIFEEKEKTFSDIKADILKAISDGDITAAEEHFNRYDSVKNEIRQAGNERLADYKELLTKEISAGRSEGISYTEFSYQLLQGYDFFHLYQTLGCTLQMGGSDQWGNITTGTELIRRMGGPEAKAYALTGTLITKADGSKYGKSESGAVWLDPALTSPYQFYQFFLNSADADVKKLIRVFTLLPRAEIERLETEHAAAPHLRLLQKALAQDVTTRVHSAAATEAAVAASQVLFGGGDLATLDEATLLDVFAGVPRFAVSAETLGAADVATLLSEGVGGGIFASKGEARKMVQNNGLKINRQKVSDAQQPAAALPLLLGRYLVVQKGKHYSLVAVGQ